MARDAGARPVLGRSAKLQTRPTVFSGLLARRPLPDGVPPARQTGRRNLTQSPDLREGEVLRAGTARAPGQRAKKRDRAFARSRVAKLDGLALRLLFQPINRI